MLENLKQKQEEKKIEQQKRMQEEAKRKQEERKILEEMAYAQAELNQLKQEHGIEDEKGLTKLISKFLNKREAREKVLVSKKKYIRLCLLGMFGAHRFYSKQYFLGTVYLLLFWTGISFSMTIIDWMIVAPMEADENGMILI